MFRALELMPLAGTLVALALSGMPVSAQRKKPAVLFAGSGDRCGYEVALKLVDAGFVLDQVSGELPPLETLKKYNVLVISGLGMANADGSLPAGVQQSIDRLHGYLEAGGGVLFLPSYCQMIGGLPPQNAFLQPLGLTPLFDEFITDPETSAAGTSWKIHFAYTSAIAAAPFTEGVTGLWYPAIDRSHGRAGAFGFLHGRCELDGGGERQPVFRHHLSTHQ